MAGLFDWSGDGECTPSDSPFAFSGHYLWRAAGVRNARKGYIEGATPSYTDRMSQSDREKAKQALEGFTFYGTRPNGDIATRCQKAVDTYYGEGKYELIAYELTCNISTGYPIGVFWMRNA